MFLFLFTKLFSKKGTLFKGEYYLREDITYGHIWLLVFIFITLKTNFVFCARKTLTIQSTFIKNNLIGEN